MSKKKGFFGRFRARNGTNTSRPLNRLAIITRGEAVTFQQSLGVKFFFDNTRINAETSERLKYIETTVTKLDQKNAQLEDVQPLEIERETPKSLLRLQQNAAPIQQP